MNPGRTLGMLSACLLLAGSTIAFADDLSPVQPVAVTPMLAVSAAAPVVSLAAAPVANTQIVAMNTTAPMAAMGAPADPLHADSRWPLFSNCINNTATPDAFQACLQLAFQGVGPNDQLLAMLAH